MSADTAVLPGIPAVVISDWRSAAQIVDHTLLAPEATRAQLAKHCSEADHYGFHCVVVNPCYVAAAAAQLRGTSVKVAAVIGFPLGASLTVTKLTEAEAAMHNGARELEMVINIGALKSGDRLLLQTEMRLLAKLAHEGNARLKVILENALLTQEEKILGCALARDAGADFVKTSTGFARSGATAADVALMRGVVGHVIGVKAAGGIRTAADFRSMVDAGANRIGTSAGISIVRELGAPE
jgi:deoxyribose-phosphate aldolase